MGIEWVESPVESSVDNLHGLRNWDELVKRHKAFWDCADVDRPLVRVTHDDYVDTELVASAMANGELEPHSIDPSSLFREYDRVAAAREIIDDDTLGVAEPLLGVPWLEAICGCRIMNLDGRSLWPTSPENSDEIREVCWSHDNPWFQKLLEVLHKVVDHAAGRYAVSVSHLRGPTDILVALLGTERFFTSFYDEPEFITELAKQAANVWLQVAHAEMKIVPSYRGGYAVRQFGLWAPAQAIWLQDDTSSMISLKDYQRFFLEPMRRMSVFPYTTLHLHTPSLHLAETLGAVPNIRAVNFYFDATTITLQDAMPVLRRMQERRIPLVLAKDVYEGFSLEEYEEILASLAPSGLSIHLKADSVEEGRAAMAYVRERAGTHPSSGPLAEASGGGMDDGQGTSLHSNGTSGGRSRAHLGTQISLAARPGGLIT